MEYDRNHKGSPLIHGYEVLVTGYTLDDPASLDRPLRVVVLTVEDLGTEIKIKVRMTQQEAQSLALHLQDATGEVPEYGI